MRQAACVASVASVAVATALVVLAVAGASVANAASAASAAQASAAPASAAARAAADDAARPRHAELADLQRGLRTAETFDGPFAHWIDARRDHGARGDGQADDTAALQRALDALGTDATRTTLYLPAGRYRITRTLNLGERRGVRIVGEHPETTSIDWDGRAGGTLLDVRGVSYSAVGRLTLDGRARAGTLLYLSYNRARTQEFFPTHLEFTDLRLRDADFCMRAGRMKGGVAEAVVRRAHFLDCRQAGVSIQDWNSLNWWIWDAYFERNGHGVTNTFGRDASSGAGAGNFHVHRSVFVASREADVSIWNTQAFSVNDSLSHGSKHFLRAYGPISSPAQQLLLRNHVDATLADPVVVENPGPLVLLDNVFRTRDDQRIVLAGSAPGDLVSVGNRFAAARPWGPSAPGRAVSVVSVDDAFGVVLPAMPVSGRPAFAAHGGRRIVEFATPVTSASIAAALRRLAEPGSPPTVLVVPPGVHPITETVRIGPGSDVRIAGAGFMIPGASSTLRWVGARPAPVIEIAGPARVSIESLDVIGGDGSGDGIRVRGIDQPGSLVRLDQAAVAEMQRSRDANVRIEGLRHATVEGHPLYHVDNPSNDSLRVTGTGPASPGVRLFGALTLENGNSYAIRSGARVLVTGSWYEGPTQQFVRLEGAGSFTMAASHVAPEDDTGERERDSATHPAVEFGDFAGRVGLVSLRTVGTVGGAGSPALDAGLIGILIATSRAEPLRVGRSASLLNVAGRTSGTGALSVDRRMPSAGPVDADALRRVLADLREARPVYLPEAAAAGARSLVTLRRVSVRDMRGAGLVIDGR
ncbi:MAG: hypothetical protein RJA99_2885 [Pseudomonadota bacterium]|jgi:hypothetical protein